MGCQNLKIGRSRDLTLRQISRKMLHCELRSFSMLCRRFKSIALVSTQKKQVQNLVEKLNKRRKKKKERKKERADCSISLKFGTEFDRGEAGLLYMFKVKGQRSRSRGHS